MDGDRGLFEEQALVLAEVAARVLVSRRAKLDLLDALDADERGLKVLLLEQPDGLDGAADRPALAAVRMDGDRGLFGRADKARLDEIDLGLDGGEIVLCAALEHEVPAQLGDVRNLRDVQPDVLGQHRRQAGHDFVGLPALPLEIHDVRLHEHRAAVAEFRHRLGAERQVRVLLNFVAEVTGGGLEEVPVAGRALGVELEVLDLPVFEDDELDVLPADVHDHVGLWVEVQAGLRVGDRFDQGAVRADHVLEDVLGVAGGACAENFQRAALPDDLLLELADDVDGVLDRVALGELIGLGDDVLVGVEQDAFGAGRAAVQSQEGAHVRSRLELFLRPMRFLVALLERGQILGAGAEPLAAGGLLLFDSPLGDVPDQLVAALVDRRVGIFLDLNGGELDRADGGEVLGVLGDDDELFGRLAFGQLDATFLPDHRNVVHPAVAHALDVAVGAAEQEHLGAQRVAAGQHRHVLLNDGLEQRGHQLVGRHALLLQAVDVGFGEDAALAGDRVQLDPEVAHLAELLGRDLELGVDLVDDRAGSAGTLVVHRRDLLFLAGLLILFEDDDLGVLAAELDDGLDIGVEFFDGQRDGVDFLNEAPAEARGDRARTGAGHEDAKGVLRNAVEVRFDLFEKLDALFRLLGVVALIVLPEDLIRRRIDDDGLDGGRADVQAHNQALREGVGRLEGPLLALRARARFLGCRDGELDQIGRAGVGFERGRAAAAAGAAAVQVAPSYATHATASACGTSSACGIPSAFIRSPT